MIAADTAWIMTATALVLLMTLPGLALFYGGLVRGRNILSVFMHCYAIACLMSVLWFLVGYSIAFGEGGSGLWGGLGKAGLNGIDASTAMGNLPEVADCRRLCGTDRVRVRDAVFGALDAAVLCAGGALDLGRRDAGRWRHFR